MYHNDLTDTPEEYLEKVLHQDFYKDFIKRQAEDDGAAEDEFQKKGIEVAYTQGSEMLFYVWVRDREAAAFSFAPRPTNGPTQEISFQTQDPHLVDTFQKVFNDEWEKADCKKPGCKERSRSNR